MTQQKIRHFIITHWKELRSLDLTPAEYQFYVWLDQVEDQRNRCIKTTGKHFNCSPEYARQVFQSLEKKGYVEKRKGFGNNYYWYPIPLGEAAGEEEGEEVRGG